MRRIYCRKANVEYVEITKCACSSIKAALLATDGQVWDAPNVPHMSKHWLFKPTKKPSLVFTFVRDPVERLLSSFRHKLKTGNAMRLTKKAKTINTDASPDEWAEWVMSQPIDSLDKHWALQIRALNKYKTGVNKGCPITLYKFENLRHVWDILSSTYELKPLPLRNVTSDQPNLESFSTEIMARLRNYYTLDYQLYNSFDFSKEV